MGDRTLPLTQTQGTLESNRVSSTLTKATVGYPRTSFIFHSARDPLSACGVSQLYVESVVVMNYTARYRFLTRNYQFMIRSHPTNNARTCAVEKAWLNKIEFNHVAGTRICAFIVVSLNGQTFVNNSLKTGTSSSQFKNTSTPRHGTHILWCFD